MSRNKQTKPEFEFISIDLNRPVVFLDMCGVIADTWLNTQRWAWEDSSRFTRRHETLKGDSTVTAAHRLLVDIFKQHDVQVVVVSSWVNSMLPMYHPDINEFREFLGYPDVMGSLYTQGGIGRGMAVSRFIKEKKILKWVVIDDSREQMYKDKKFFNDRHFIHPKAKYGFWLKEADRLCQILEGFV